MDAPGPTQGNSGHEATERQGEAVERLLPFLEKTIDAMAEAVIV